MHISDLTKEYTAKLTQPRAGPKIDYSFQELGVEMSKEFGKKVWPLFHDARFTEDKIRRAWVAYQRGKVKNWRYFMGILIKTK